MAQRKFLTDIEALKNPSTAELFLKKALERLYENEDPTTFLLALRKITKAQGGMTALSRKVKINRQNLYRTFANDGNPKFRSLGAILKGLGYRLTIEPIRRTPEQDEQIRREIEEKIEEIISNISADEEEEELA